MLRCQVIINMSLCESMSRKVSESGKIAPSIVAQVTMRPRFTGRTGEHVVALEEGFADQCASDSVGDGVHCLFRFSSACIGLFERFVPRCMSIVFNAGETD